MFSNGINGLSIICIKTKFVSTLLVFKYNSRILLIMFFNISVKLKAVVLELFIKERSPMLCNVGCGTFFKFSHCIEVCLFLMISLSVNLNLQYLLAAYS